MSSLNCNTLCSIEETFLAEGCRLFWLFTNSVISINPIYSICPNMWTSEPCVSDQLFPAIPAIQNGLKYNVSVCSHKFKFDGKYCFLIVMSENGKVPTASVSSSFKRTFCSLCDCCLICHAVINSLKSVDPSCDFNNSSNTFSLIPWVCLLYWGRLQIQSRSNRLRHFLCFFHAVHL